MPPLPRKQAAALVKRRHPEWLEHERRWRWLADSYEGGNRYRFADYSVRADDPLASGRSVSWNGFGVDPTTSIPYQISYGQICDRNLIPHMSETDEAGAKTYVLRLARTPVPKTLEKIVRRHLSRIFSKEVKRSGPPALESWWTDVDGRGTTVDRWVRKVVGPLLLVTGQLDLQFGRPATDPDAAPLTRADERQMGLDRCIASYILPENMVWWRLDAMGRDYAECLVYCRCEDDGAAFYRHWTATECNAYDSEGKSIPGESFTHPYGRPPIKRVFDEPKARCRHVGQPRYESVAELQKAKYNTRSEIALGDVQQSHPTLMCPEDYITAQGEVLTGPSGLLPMKRDGVGQYVPWQYVDPPKGAADALRQHAQDYDDEALADAGLTKPAGMTSHGTVHQSGISKIVDQQDGYDYLAEVAETLSDAEVVAAELALLVLSDGNPSPADQSAVKVQYPREFELYSTEQLSTVISQVQQSAAGAGQLPVTEVALLSRLVTVALPGLDDETQAAILDEITTAVAARAAAPAVTTAGPATDPTTATAAPPPDAPAVLNPSNPS